MGHGHGNGRGPGNDGLTGGGKGVGATVTSVTLTSGTDSVGSTGNDLILATAATLNSGDSLVGNTGMDTLSLSGSGTFNLNSRAASIDTPLHSLLPFAHVDHVLGTEGEWRRPCLDSQRFRADFHGLCRALFHP